MNVKIDRLSADGFLLSEISRLSKQGISIAVDFDSTLCLTDGYPHIIAPNGNCFYVLKQWQNLGCKILLHTMRHGKDLDDAVEWCKDNGFTFDGINHNPENEERDPEYNEKMYAVFYIDDKNFGVPLLHDAQGRIRDHVDWSEIDRTYTPFLWELIIKVNNLNNNG